MARPSNGILCGTDGNNITPKVQGDRCLKTLVFSPIQSPFKELIMLKYKERVKKGAFDCEEDSKLFLKK